ncbi:MAG: hypothetical protein QGD92_13330 [Gammaproteobacteria bacterium]|nr:hypothetical protein [Gammaproteobacteria bacterium]
MDQVQVKERESERHLQTRFSVIGEHGVLRAWHDGCFHASTREPTFCVDVVYVDRLSGKQQRKLQRGLRASTVANICACVCLGEERLTSALVGKINEKFRINTRH